MILSKKIKSFAFSILNKSKFRGFHLFNDLKFYSSTFELSANTIFDVGANVGQTSQEIRKFFPKYLIHAFEPVDSTFDILRKNLGHDEKIILNNTALGAEEKDITIYLKQESCVNSLLNEFNPCTTASKILTQNIRIVTGDDYCSLNDIESIFLLKTDTEGYDLEVLKGFKEIISARKIIFILAEVNFDKNDFSQSNFNEVNEYLIQQEYKLVGFYDLAHHGGYLPNLSYCNCLWTSFT